MSSTLTNPCAATEDLKFKKIIRKWTDDICYGQLAQDPGPGPCNLHLHFFFLLILVPSHLTNNMRDQVLTIFIVFFFPI